MNPDDDILRDVARSLEDVGKTKAAGYLPLDTIRKFLKRDTDEYLHVLRDRRLTSYILSEQETCIASGVLVAFDPDAVDAVIERHRPALQTAGLPEEANALMRHVMMQWHEDDHVLTPFLRDLYNDPA